MGNLKQDLENQISSLSETLENAFLDFAHFAKESWLLLCVLLAVLMGIWWFADPPPPSHISMATGAPGGSQYELGKKYAAFFAKKGITINLIQTTGAVENLSLLTGNAHPVDTGFIQAGTVDPATLQDKGLVSLGAIEYTPIWFFYRGPLRKEVDFEAVNGRLKYFPNAKISIGTPGNGTYAQTIHILETAGVNPNDPQFVKLSGKQSVDALLRGQIDAAFIADAHQASNVTTLVNDPNIHFSSIKWDAGFVRLLPYLQVLDIPAGGVNMAQKIPPEDVRLLVTTTHLLVDQKLHPAIQYLFLAAEKEINGHPGFFAHRGEFPSFKGSGLPESPVFQRYEQNGQPWLMNYLPFWLAELMNRLAVIVLPFLAIAYPLLSSLPKFKTQQIYMRINRMYGILKGYELELAQGYDASLVDGYLEKLDHLEYQALKLKVPKNMSTDYYALRTNNNYVRDCLNRGEKPYEVPRKMGASPNL